MTDSLDALSLWLGQHPEWILLTIGITAFVESLAMIGVILPGIAVLYAATALAGNLDQPLLPCLIAAGAGAAAGDLISFFLGRYAHPVALKHWPFRQHPGLIRRGEQFIQRYGIPSVIVGRFVGPLRAVIPFVAGMLEMPSGRFIPISLLSSAFWAPVYIIPGYLIGQASQSPLPYPVQQEWLNLLLLAGITLGLGGMYLVHIWLHPQGETYRRWSHRLSWQHLQSPRSGEQPLAFALLLGASLIGFTLLTLILFSSDLLAPIDQGVNLLFARWRSMDGHPWAVGLTLLGDGTCLLGLSLIVSAGLWYCGDRTGAIHAGVAISLTLLLSQLIKFSLAVPRPADTSAFPASFAFPSAHSSGSSLFFILLATFIAQQIDYHKRWRAYAIAALPVALLGLSRLYLGVHWFSDVLAGILLGLAVTAACRISYSPRDRARSRPLPGWWLLGAALLWCTLYVGITLDAALIRYQPN